MKKSRMIKVTAVMKRSLTKLFLPRLFASGLTDWYVTPARTLILREKRGGLGLIHVFKLVEDAADVVSFLVDPSQEEPSLEFVIRECELTLPGRGSVFSEEVDLISPHDFRCESRLREDADAFVKKPSPLTGICCIVQRGEANKIARVALDMGAGVPAVSFGNGTGIRDKLGLLRIAIPAQKEIIHLALSPHDAETVMRMMIRAARQGVHVQLSHPQGMAGHEDHARLPETRGQRGTDHRRPGRDEGGCGLEAAFEQPDAHDRHRLFYL
jgi:hypothetical protein